MDNTMANERPHNSSRDSSPDAPASEVNSSTQVHLDNSSNRGRSVGAPSRSTSTRPSPSRPSEASLPRQATANSLASFLSSRPSSQRSQGDQPSAEDLLRDLIAATGSGSTAAADALHGVKRPHDGEASGEPSAKRDKLGEELERMAASNPVAHASVNENSTTISLPSSSALMPLVHPHAASDTATPSESTFTMGTRGALPMRPARRRQPQRETENGTGASRGDSPASSDQYNSSRDGDSGELAAGPPRR
ncbi:hypothetical protein VTK26DRAFT_5425 [Humicola hyalothermophila]